MFNKEHKAFNFSIVLLCGFSVTPSESALGEWLNPFKTDSFILVSLLGYRSSAPSSPSINAFTSAVQCLHLIASTAINSLQ
jgi:hypothetical protein